MSSLYAMIFQYMNPNVNDLTSIVSILTRAISVPVSIAFSHARHMMNGLPEGS